MTRNTMFRSSASHVESQKAAERNRRDGGLKRVELRFSRGDESCARGSEPRGSRGEEEAAG